MLRFVDDDTVVMNDYSVGDPGYGRKVESALKQHKLRIEKLPYFYEDHVAEDGSTSAVGNYVNYLRMERLVIVPAYGAPQNQEAVETLEELLPDVDDVPLNCVDLARQGGVLNCVSWTV